MAGENVGSLQGAICDISEDSITCQIDGSSPPTLKSKVFLRASGDESNNISGIVCSIKKSDSSFRLGLAVDKKGLSNLFKQQKLTVIDRRIGQRREASTSDEWTKRREYERRGFWLGLQSKRYFSHHAWELGNKDEYFFMKPLQSGTGSHVIVDSRDMIMMSSNNYLGLSTHPRVKEAAKKAIDKYGSSPSASSLLGGTLDIHLELEEALARIKGAEASCVFSAGYTTNLTTLVTVLNKEDSAFYDEKNHASLIDGVRLSGANGRAYHHCNVEDLDRKLARSLSKNNLVVTDSVFSMDGDIAPLPQIYRTAKSHGAALMVDEAHATGIYGERGRGLIEHFQMEGKVEIVMGSLSKVLAGVGGFIAGSKELIRILKHTARAFVFSTAIPPSMCAAILECLKIIEEEPERRERLWENASIFREGLKAEGFNVGLSASPIIPVIFPTEEQTNFMTRGLRAEGIYVTPAIYPAVKKNATRVRCTVMSSHTEEDLTKALHAFVKVRNMYPGYGSKIS
ncbi:MAG: aminotransferase class I/II-fold pyridoxal phosphate-dependent enzyme [Elusimicrobia bacterium]|nr:aminotransferase class I/II-fold pyridoxal phosphate-dependent enzyme [Elusimicrobiota bacterium]